MAMLYSRKPWQCDTEPAWTIPRPWICISKMEFSHYSFCYLHLCCCHMSQCPLQKGPSFFMLVCMHTQGWYVTLWPLVWEPISDVLKSGGLHCCNRVKERPCHSWEWNPGPSCCVVIVLTIEPYPHPTHSLLGLWAPDAHIPACIGCCVTLVS